MGLQMSGRPVCARTNSATVKRGSIPTTRRATSVAYSNRSVRASAIGSRRPRGPERARGSGSIEGRVALDRHAMAVPALREVVPHRVVLHATVVPERHRVRLPAEAAVELRRLHVAEEELQDRLALWPRQLLDARGEATVDEEPLAPGDGMRADHGMLGPGEDLAGVVDAVAAPVDVLARVHGGQRLQEPLHGLRSGTSLGAAGWMCSSPKS